MFFRITYLVWLSSTATALVFSAPKPTSVQEQGALASLSPPAPTSAPNFPHELFKRDSVGTVLVGPDNTCGYFGGRVGAPLTCPYTDSCVFVAATASSYGNVACCPSVGDCGIRFACIDFLSYYNTTICDTGCQHDEYTVKCTATSAPYCASIIFPQNSVTDYFCDSVTISSWQSIYTTWSGETDGRKFATRVVTVTDSTAPASLGKSSSSKTTSSTTTSKTTSSGVSSGAATSSTGAAGANPTVGSATTSPASSSTTAAATTNTSSGPPIGAIVGGVIGGVALIAIIAFVIWFIMRRNRKERDAAAATVSAQPPTYTTPGDGSAYAAAAAGAGSKTYPDAYGAYSPVPQQQQEMGQNNQFYQNPQQYPQNQQNLQPPQGAYYSPNSPPREDAVSPNSQAHSDSRVSQMTEAGAAGVAAGHGPDSPTPTYASNTYSAPRPGHSEMSANMAGPFPTNLHEGTYEVYGSEAPQRNEVDGQGIRR